MKKELLINGGALNAPVFSALAAEQFLTENYSFRRNQLNPGGPEQHHPACQARGYLRGQQSQDGHRGIYPF